MTADRNVDIHTAVTTAAETARSEIIHNRDRVEPALRQLDTYEEMVQAELMLERHTLGVASVAAQLLPFSALRVHGLLPMKTVPDS